MNTKAQTAQSQGSAGVVESKNASDVVQGILLAAACAVVAEILLGFLAIGHKPEAYNFLGAVGRSVVVFLSVYIIHRFALMSFEQYRPSAKDLLFFAIIFSGTILMVWIGRIMAASLGSYLSNPALGLGKVNSEIFWFAIPFAAGALLLQAILGFHFGVVFAFSLALIVGLYSQASGFLFPCFIVATTLVSCLSLSRFRARSAYVKAGMNVSVVAFPFALAFAVINGSLINPATLLALLAALIGGILCIFVASGITPVIEYLGGYVTDMRLIEMATLDHPLLKELSVQAPGTWNHCMVMGMMAEAAAEAINANPVLARVGAYFHDIGKTKKPLYFVENLGGEENRHDKLSTSMSALIIRSHVKDGIELARKHGLPRAIEDMIPQHHGTSRIEFFYDKACKEAEESGLDQSSVDESLYRYPGPKPQTREAGLLMLADGVEAAARTLSEPTPDRIQGMVQKMINKVFSSGELNECDLTLRDLHQVAKSFTRILSGIYHQRIAYAEPVEKGKPAEEEGAEESGEGGETDGSGRKTKAAGAEDKPGKEVYSEDLKRLGL